MMTIFSAIVAMAFPAASLAAGNASSPRAFVERIAQSSLGIIERQDAVQAGGVFMHSFDIRAFAQRCLVDHWTALTDDQRSEFVDLFSKTLRAKLADALSKRIKGRVLNYTVGTAKAGAQRGIVEVAARVAVDGERIDLTYYLKRSTDGYRLVDYDVGGALLSRNYRGQFNYLMRNYGYAGMIERMRQKAEVTRSPSLASRE